MQTADSAAQTRILPVNKWPHPWPSQSGLRHMIFNAEKTGFDRCIRRIGRRVLIDEAEFFKWIDEVAKKNSRLQRQPRGGRNPASR